MPTNWPQNGAWFRHFGPFARGVFLGTTLPYFLDPPLVRVRVHVELLGHAKSIRIYIYSPHARLKFSSLLKYHVTPI